MATTESFEDAVKRAREVAANIRNSQPQGTIVGAPVMTPPLKRQASSGSDDEYGGGQPKRFQNEYGSAIPNPNDDSSQQQDPNRPSKHKLYLDGLYYQGEKYLDLLIPGNRVGIIIGKGGETIKSLQNQASVKMLVIQDSTEAGSREKQLRISGPPERVDYARKLVEDLINKPEGQQNDRQQGGHHQQQQRRPPHMNGGGGHGGGYGNGGPMGPMGGMGGRPNYFEYPVSPKMTGLVIGKQGETIRKIQAETGCRVQFDSGKIDSQGNKVCQFTGSQDSISRALEMVKNICQQNGDVVGGNNGREAQEEMKLLVPAGRTGTVIGRGGETIKSLKLTTGCNIELEKGYLNEHDEKCFILRGSAEKIQYAQQLVTEKAGGNTRVLSSTIKNNPYQDTVLAHHLMQTGAHGGMGGAALGYGLPSAGGAPASSQGSSEDMYNAYYAAYYQQLYAQTGDLQSAASAAAAAAAAATAAATGGAAAGQAPGGAAAGQPADNEAVMKQWIEYYSYHNMTKEAEAMEAQLKEHQKSKANGHGDR